MALSGSHVTGPGGNKLERIGEKIHPLGMLSQASTAHVLTRHDPTLRRYLLATGPL